MGIKNLGYQKFLLWYVINSWRLSDFLRSEGKSNLDLEYKLKGAVIKMKGFGVFG